MVNNYYICNALPRVINWGHSEAITDGITSFIALQNNRKMQTEIWKDIIGYEGIYQVSNYGRVKSLKRTIYKKGINKNCILNDKILKQNKVGHGYNAVMLYKSNCKVKSMQIHQLVAITFLNHCPNGFKIVIDHKDNNKLNNHVDNLQLINHRQNCSKDQKKT